MCCTRHTYILYNTMYIIMMINDKVPPPQSVGGTNIDLHVYIAYNLDEVITT